MFPVNYKIAPVVKIKYRTTVKTIMLLISLLLIVTFTACNNRNDEAETLLNHINMMRTDGNWIEKKKLLNKVISEYNGTNAASEATIKLYSLIMSCNKKAENDLTLALSAKDKHMLKHPGEIPDLSKLRQYGFQKSKGVDIRIIKDKNRNLLMTSEHIAGSLIFSVDLPNGKFIKETRK